MLPDPKADLHPGNESNANPPAEPAGEEASTLDGPVFVGVVGGALGAGVVAGLVWYLLRRWRRRQPRAPGRPTPLLPNHSYTSDNQSDGYDPNVSQNYQHYAIELNSTGPGSLAKPHRTVLYGEPQEMVVAERPQEMVVEDRPQELPVWK